LNPPFPLLCGHFKKKKSINDPSLRRLYSLLRWKLVLSKFLDLVF